MPDLSKRPARYITFLVAAALAGGYVVTQYGVRVGNDPSVAQLRSENAELRQQAASVVDPPPARSGLTCASFPNQQAAQTYWTAHRTQYPEWDGNHNNLVCEQLKSTAGPTPSRTGGGSALAAPARSPEPAVRSTAPTSVVTKTVTRTRTQTKTKTRTVVVPADSDGHVDNPAPPKQEIPKEPVTKPTAPSKAQILASGRNFGLYTATQEEFTGIESMMGRQATVRGWFQGWDTGFRSANVDSAWSDGQLPLLTWETRSLNGGADSDYSLAEIAAGEKDAYLRDYATGIVRNGLPLAIRLDHEMNGNWYPWSEAREDAGNEKGVYVAAWRHVHDIFQAAGANNLVLWLWAPNRVDPLDPAKFPAIDNYYPGADYVDYVGMSGYYREGANKPSFSRTFDRTLAELARVAPGKPVLLAEVGATSDAKAGYKLTWVKDFFAGLREHPEIRGFVWFNYAVTKDDHTDDWRVNFDAGIKNAFSAGLTASGYGTPYGKKSAW